MKIKAPLPAIGVLIRRMPVRIRDISAAGCLLDSLDALPEDSIGLLELVVNGQRHSETLRVCRSTRFPGSPWPWRSGAHFLALTAPPHTSLRNVVARFEIIDEMRSVPDALARMYRHTRMSARPPRTLRARSQESHLSLTRLETVTKETPKTE